LPEPELALLVEAAGAAGREALRFWRRDPRVWDKGEHGPVTEADLAANEVLAEVLRGARPGYGWLSEETPDDAARLDCRRVFVVDPIDGTRAFVAGEDGWAVSVALVEDGRAVAGVVALPALGRLYAAFEGQGATRDGHPIRASVRRDLAGAEVLASRPTLAPEHWPGGLPELRRSFRPSLAHRMCLAAEGRSDAMLTLRPTWEWDIAAGAVICAEAGARVTDAEGAGLRLNSAGAQVRGVIAAPPALHAALVARRATR
jgi:myo-inositol-1(or 4)-monophosphatase